MSSRIRRHQKKEYRKEPPLEIPEAQGHSIFSEQSPGNDCAKMLPGSVGMDYWPIESANLKKSSFTNGMALPTFRVFGRGKP